jgi:hypothetical protein
MIADFQNKATGHWISIFKGSAIGVLQLTMVDAGAPPLEHKQLGMRSNAGQTQLTTPHWGSPARRWTEARRSERQKPGRVAGYLLL